MSFIRGLIVFAVVVGGVGGVAHAAEVHPQARAAMSPALEPLSDTALGHTTRAADQVAAATRRPIT